MQTRDMLTKERFLLIGIIFLATCLKEVLSQNTIEAGTYAAGTCPPEYATADVLFCNGACGDDWGDDETNCQQADADAYCKLKNCDENGFAESFVIDQISRNDDPMTPGFGCMYGKEKLNVDFDKYEGTWFGIVDVHFSTGTAETHGGGQIVRDVECAETCSDGIQNQDETDIDCGGTICELCVSPISVEWTGATYSQCYVNAQQYSDDRKDNPIFGGGGFVGTMSLDACKEYCLSGVTDSYGRPCVAIEFSSIDENVEASCALAWGCDYLEYWSGGSVYYLGSLPGELDDGYQFFHDGHCASGWLGGNTLQPTTLACYENCKTNPQCFYFAYDNSFAYGTNCALYGDEGCTDDNNYPTYSAYTMMRA